MIINKFKAQKLSVLEKTQPDLFATVNAHMSDLNEEQKGKVAGLIIEYVIKSGGDVSILSSDETETLFVDELGGID